MWLIIGAAITIGVVLLLGRLSDVLLPFFAACVLAYFLQPLVQFNRRRLHLPRHYIAVWVTLFEVLLVVATVSYFIVPKVVGEVNSLIKMVDSYALHDSRTPLIPDFIEQYINQLDEQKVEELIESGKLDGVLSRGETILTAAIHTVLHMLEWLLMFIYVVFIMIYYDQISRGFKKISPKRYRARTMAVISDVTDAMNRYFRGQGVMALCAMVLYSIGFTLVRSA